MASIEHFGWLVSPYSAKTRSYLRYKGADFRDVAPTGWQLWRTIQPAVGRAIMPTVRLADGTWLQDSSAIIDAFEASGAEPTITPPGPAQRVAALLLELFADEWLPMAALHYRWNVPENARFAIDEFARSALPWAPAALARPAVERVARKMQGYLPILGVDEGTIPGVEATAAELIAALDAALGAHPYVLGGRPCIGDFALYGPLWAHLYRDPGTTALFDGAPNVVAWMERLGSGCPASGPFLPDDAVPDALATVFARICGDQLAWVRTLVAAIDAWCDAHPGAARVPRALGTAPFQIGGRSGRRKLATFVQWKAQRPRRAFEAAPGPAGDWLRAVGGPDAEIPPIRNPFAIRDFKAVLARG